MARRTQTNGTPTKKQEEEQKVADVGVKELAKLMKKIDFCMMTTVAEDGRLYSRPMSNNQKVEWDGDSWFFAEESSTQAQQIQRNPHVNLAYAQPRQITFVSVIGKGEIVRNDEKKKELWEKQLAMWFPNGPEDPNLVLIKVTGTHATYWGKDGEAQIDLKMA